MDDETAALIKVRTLRHDGYRCRYRESPHGPICGAFSRDVGRDPTSEEFVSLCPAHAPEEALYVPTLTAHRPAAHRRRYRR